MNPEFAMTLQNVVAVGIAQPAEARPGAGDCVRIDGSGRTARVIRA